MSFFESDNFQKKDYSLLKVNIDIIAGMIFLNQSTNPAPLRYQLGALAERLDAFPMQEM